MKNTNQQNQKKQMCAIDIGTTKIVALVGELTESGKVKITGLSTTPSKGVRRGAISNIEEAVASISMAVEAVKMKTGVDFKEVYVGIAGQNIRSLRNRWGLTIEGEDPKVTSENVERLVKEMFNMSVESGEEVIHVLPQSFTIDEETDIKNPVGYYGRRLEANFHIVIGHTRTSQNIKRALESVGIEMKGLFLEQIASADSVLTEAEKEVGVAIVDIGGGTTDLAIYHDNVIQHTAVIPFGGDVITNDIKEGMNILRDKAEELKTTHGSAIGDTESDDVVAIKGINGREAKEIRTKTLAYIIQYRIEEIIDAVTYEIDYSGYFEKLGAGIVITGGGAMLKNIVQLIKFKTGLDVKIGYPGENLSCELVDDIRNPKYSTSVGLVLKGLEKEGVFNRTKVSKTNINTGRLNNAKREKKNKKIANAVQLSFNNTFGKIKDNLGNFFYEDNDTPM